MRTIQVSLLTVIAAALVVACDTRTAPPVGNTTDRSTPAPATDQPVAARVAAPVTTGTEDTEERPARWPAWRGPDRTGVAVDADPPLHWDEQTNMRWKTEVPGKGHSSPVVWNDRIFLMTAVETEEQVAEATVKAVEEATPGFHRANAHMPRKVLQFTAMALNRADGSVLWRKVLRTRAPHEATHADGSWASGSALTDGERVFVYFGSHGLYCLDMDGALEWEKDLGQFRIKAHFGEGTSPALAGDSLIVNQDHEGESFIVALDARTGDERWKVARDEVTSWSTPLVVDHDGRAQIVTSATGRIRSYDAASGEVIWETGGMTGNVIPSPVAGYGLVFCASGFRGSALVAVRLASAEGDLSGRPEAIAWSRDRGTPYVPSPLLSSGRLYILKGSSGTLSCIDAATGTAHYEEHNLEGVRDVYSSPVAASGRVYVTGRRGTTLVIEDGPALKVLATNKLDDEFTASAALVGKELYLRGHRKLYCIVGNH